MSKLTAWRWYRPAASAIVLVVFTLGTYLVAECLSSNPFQILYAVASVFVVTTVLLFGVGWLSPYLPRPDSGLEKTQPQSPERSKGDASAD